MTGAGVGQLASGVGLASANDVSLFTLTGMAAFGAAVIGAPLTMALLVIEISDRLAVAGPMLIGVVTATLTVRAVFGYSFATWRFHKDERRHVVVREFREAIRCKNSSRSYEVYPRAMRTRA